MNTINTNLLSDGRIPGLDALRGLAAIGVAVHHYHFYYHAGPNHWILQPAYNGAGFFVELFFVLSGFLLTQVYLDIKNYKVLVIRRLARLFPLQWLTLLLVALEQFLFTQAYGKPFIYKNNDWYHFFLNVLLLQESGLQSDFSFNGPSWSISVEWIVNLLFFSLILYSRILLSAALVFAVACAGLLAISQPKLTVLTMSFGFLDTGLLRAGFGFFIGVVAAKIVLLFQPKPNFLWDIVAIGNAIVLIYFLSSKTVNSQLHFQIVIVGLIMPMLVIACSKSKFISRFLSIRPLTWLGDVSYAVYLIHFPLLILIWGVRFHLPIQINSGEAIVCYVVFLGIVSHIVFNYFERPAQKMLRHYFINKFVTVVR